ncbi:MAG: hypothetical protein LUC94_10320 [Clostridiales bacterium]|nr:hypothetical protein [Clostridiales bacterium]
METVPFPMSLSRLRNRETDELNNKVEEGNMWLSETKRKFILCLILVLAFIGVAVLLFTDRKQTSEKQSRLRTVVEEMKSLEQERDSLEEELVKLDESDPDMPVRTATAQIVVTDLREEVYTSLYPSMKEYGMGSVLAISGESFPGADACISREQFDEMTRDGWDYCLFWDGDEDLEIWFSEMEEHLAQEGLAMPTVLYVGDGPGNWNQDTICLNHGISIVVHRQENVSVVIATDADAVSAAQMDTGSADSLTDPSLVPEEAIGEEKTEPEKTPVVAEPEHVPFADGAEPGYRYSAASVSDALPSVPASEIPIVAPLQVPLTQTAASDSAIPDGDMDAGVWHLESLMWNSQDLSETISSVTENGENLTIEYRMPLNGDGTDQPDEMDAFLDVLRSSGLALKSFTESREMMQEYQTSLGEWKRQKEEERQRIQDQMKELNEQIAAMGEK